MIMPGPNEPTIRTTGGQVDEMTLALIEAANDKDGKVKDIISVSLVELGRKQPALVLSTCHAFLMQHSKLAQSHRVVILATMEKIVKNSIDQINQQLAVDIIVQASDELTKSKDVVPDWQTAASGVLVAMAKKFINEVMEELMKKFQPGVLPHFFVVQTLGNIATNNVYGIVPFLNVILGTMLPMLGMAKQDNIRWVISAALGKFAEAILDYVANIEKAPDPTVRKDTFSNEIYSAYDVLFNIWLQSREKKLRIAIVETVGLMARIMTPERLEEQLPKLINGTLALYKKQEPYHVTLGLCCMLVAATDGGTTMLEPFLELLLNTLFPQLCQGIDYNNPYSIKNHNELLRCFAVIARSFSDRLVGFLLQKLENNNEKIRIGALAVFRHIINASGPHMEDKKSYIVTGLKMMLTETNNKVKKSFAQVVISMADHGYLELEGGQLMVEFIVRQCSLGNEPQGRRPTDMDYVTSDALRSMCDNILQLATTTVDIMEPVLWPFLLEFVADEQYTESIGTLCKSIAHIAAKKREENADDYIINYDELVNIPKPHAAIARFMVMVGYPMNGRNRGLHVLYAMKALSPNLHENLVGIWDAVVPKLIQYLEDAMESDDKWSQKNWEDLVLKMLSKSLDQIEDEAWVSRLGEVMGEQLSLYHSMPDEKNFLYKCLGIVLRKSTKKDFVMTHLDIIFSTVKHQSQQEREGCAIAMGFCASSHLDTVLTKLETVARVETPKRSSGLLGFIKDKTSSENSASEQTKATLMLCYGYVTLYSPASLIVSRIEATILRTINPHFSSVKDVVVKQNLIRAIDLIGKALHPDHLKTVHLFSKRNDLLNSLLAYIKQDSTTHLSNETKALCLTASATLVQLDPKLTDADLFDLVKTSIESVFSLPPDGIPVKKAKEVESYESQMEQEALMELTLESLDNLLQQLLLKDLNPDGMESIFKHLAPWMVSLEDVERQRAVESTWKLITCYHSNMQLGLGHPETMTNAGNLLGNLVPRCTDPNMVVRQVAIDCVQVVLKILQRYEGHDEDHKDKMIDAIPTLKDRLIKGDSNVLFSVASDLSKVFSKKIPPSQLVPFVDKLMDGLLDPQSHSSSGACVILNGMIKSRGSELYQEVERLMGGLHDHLALVSFAQTKTGALRSVRMLASHHLLTSMQTLLNYPIPWDEQLRECWQVIGQDPQITQSIFDHMLETLLRSLPYEERPDPKDRKKTVNYACHEPVAIASALGEIFQVTESQDLVKENFHRLFSAFLVLIASMVGAQPPRSKDEDKKKDKKEEPKSKDKRGQSVKDQPKVTPSSITIESFRLLLIRGQCDDLIEYLEENEIWSQFEDTEKYPDAFIILARGIAIHESKHMSKIVASLSVVLSSMYETQRVAVAGFFSELVNQKCSGDMILVELLMNNLLGRLVDANHIVRMLCIRGLGNVSSVGSEQVQKFSTTILSAMMAGMDDKDDFEDSITLEAMSGLSKILAEIDEATIRAILINIALRIRPCFEKERGAVRAAAFTLFGNLSRFGDGPSKAPFHEQIHSNFVSLLMHLNDPDLEVIKSCKYALRLLGPLAGSESMNAMLQKVLLDDAHLHYGEFINDLVKIIINDFSEKVNFYITGGISFFKSNSPEIRSNAAMFVGFLMGTYPKEKHTSLSKEHFCGALILLLKDEDATVRSKAAEAMSRLCEY